MPVEPALSPSHADIQPGAEPVPQPAIESGIHAGIDGPPARRGVATLARRATAALARGLADLVVPPLCVACRVPVADHGVLCPTCWRAVDFVRAPFCDRLGIPLPFDPGYGGVVVSTAALADPPAWGRARVVAVHRGVMRRLIHDLKYRDRHDPRRLLGRWLAEAGAELLADADLVVPVPLARRRLLARRFNQSALVACEAARLADVAFEPQVLVKRRATPPQVGLTHAERRRNVAGAFALVAGRKAQVRGRRIVLVDDVITTGATLDACTRVLLSGGAARVDVLALAVVTDPADVGF